MTAWNDYNDADAQNNFDTIPKGTIAPVRMTIKPGGLDDYSRGWTGGYATRSKEGESVYLNCEFVVTQGEYAKRKIWSLIGLYSPKGVEWSNMGRSFVRAILNSARGLSDKDTSPRAIEARRIQGFADLDGIEFLAKIDVEKDQNDQPKNVIKFAVTPDHKEYSAFQAGGAPVASAGFQPPTSFRPAAGGVQAPSGFQPPAQSPSTFQPPAQAPAVFQAPAQASFQAPAQPQSAFQTQAQPQAQTPAPTGFQPQQQPAPAANGYQPQQQAPATNGFQPQQQAPAQTQNGGASFARPAWAQ